MPLSPHPRVRPLLIHYNINSVTRRERSSRVSSKHTYIDQLLEIDLHATQARWAISHQQCKPLQPIALWTCQSGSGDSACTRTSFAGCDVRENDADALKVLEELQCAGSFAPGAFSPPGSTSPLP